MHHNDERWTEVRDFPGYSINEEGLVRNDRTGRIMKWTRSGIGVPIVSLRRDRTYGRQVSTLMVQSWFDPPENPRFNTVVHLDGDRWNCRIDNLVLRPRWFALAYNKELEEPPFPRWDYPIILVETGEVFEHAKEAAIQYGILQMDIFLSIWNQTDRPVFPGAWHFRLAEKTY